MADENNANIYSFDKLDMNRYRQTDNYTATDLINSTTGGAKDQRLNDMSILGLTSNWSENRTPQSDGLKPYVVSMSGVSNQDLAKSVDNVDQYNTHANNSPWTNVQRQFVSILKKRVQENGFVEAHTKLKDGADLVWARAIAQTKFELGQQRYNELLNSNDEFKAQVNQHLSNSAEDVSWRHQQIYRLGSNKIRLVTDLSNTKQIDNMKSQSGKDLAKRLLPVSDVVNVVTPDGATNDQNLMDKRQEQYTTMNANEGLIFGDERVNSNLQHQIDNVKHFTKDEPTGVTRDGITSVENFNSRVSSDVDNSRVNSSDRMEYVIAPSQTVQMPQYTENDAKQTRYWWRAGDIAENSPVTVKELMTALGSVIPDNTKKYTLNSYLQNALSTESNVDGLSSEDVPQDSQVVDLFKNGKHHQLSPSNVETMVTTLSVLHDAGVDYDVHMSKGAIQLQLKDNSAAQVLLLDPVNPALTGQVRTRERVYWRTRLGAMTYKTQAEKDNNPNSESKHALLSLIDKNGKEYSPYQDYKSSKYSKKTYNKMFRTVSNDLSKINVNNSMGQVDLDKTRLMALSRYAALDQHSKNRLAVAPLVNILGLDKATFDKQTQSYMDDAKLQTINRLVVRGGYRGNLNLGSEDSANLSKVQISRDDGQGNIEQVLSNDPTLGDVSLDFSHAIVGDDQVNNQNSQPKFNPYQLSSEESNNFIADKYVDARINYLSMLTGPDQAKTNDSYGDAQAQFKKILNNEVTDLQSTGYGTKEITRESLDIDSQKLVLDSFKDGILNAYRDEQGVNDDALNQQRKVVLNSTNNPVKRARRLEVYDGLVDQMNMTFGNAPVHNGVKINSGINLSPQDYVTKADQLTQYRSDGSEKMQTINNIHGQMETLLSEVNAPAFNIDDDNLKHQVFMGMSYREQVQQLNNIEDSGQKAQALQQYQQLHDKLLDTVPLDRSLNVTRMIEHTSDDINSELYGFKMAQAVQRSKYAHDLVGSNDVASQRVQERSVQYDPDSGMSINELRAADKNPESQEFKLRQYLADVKSGKKEFSFDDPDNPDPSAFNSDGTGLIHDMSKNEFKAQALEAVKKRLEARGATVSDQDIKIDKRGIVHYKADLPYYSELGSQQQENAKGFAKFDADKYGNNDKYLQPNEGNKGFVVVKKTGRVYTQTVPGKLSQPIEGSFGQIFAPDHDGLIRSQYNRFDGQNPDGGQLVYQARYRGWLQNPSRDANGNWDMDALKKESENGLGINNRLRVMGYDQAMMREVRQAIDMELSTRDIGDITKFNSNTRMNKLLHGEILGDQIKTNIKHPQVNRNTQAIRETELGAVRFNDESMDATKVTKLISYAKSVPNVLKNMSESGLLDDVKNSSDVRYRLMQYMHDPTAVYGNRSIGDLANSDNQFYFSDNMTGQGKMLGPLRYLIKGTKVEQSGRVVPNLVKNENGKYLKVNGKFVGKATGTAIEQLPVFNNSYKNAFDRQSVAKSQFMTSHIIDEDTNIATMASSALTMEDGIIVSKAWADKHQISDEEDENGNPIMRSLTIGDKISDPGGNKATIAEVIDPDMDPAKADREGLLDVVQLFKQNNIDVASNEMSQISRNNGATAASYLANKSSAPMSFKRVMPDENGNYRQTDQVVTTNATLNKGTMFVTDQTVNHKVTMDKGRKASFFMTLSDNAKGARAAGNWHFRGDNSLQVLREMSLSMGLDFDSKSLHPANYDEIADKTSQMEYKVDKSDLYHPDQMFNKTNMKHANKPKADQFIDAHGSISKQGSEYLSQMMRGLRFSGRIAYNSDQASPNSYDAGQDFLNKLPDGGVLKLPDNMQVTLPTGKNANQLYILPKRMRSNTLSMDDTMITSQLNRSYQQLGTALAQYQILSQQSKEMNLAKDAANGDSKLQDQIQLQIDQKFMKESGVQNAVDSIANESMRVSYGGATPKHAYFKNNVLGGKTKNSVTTQLSSNPNLPLDVIELSPQIAKKLGFVRDPKSEDGMGYMKGHPSWTHLHVHRDPIWREQGSLGFRVKVSDNPNFKSVKVNPVMASLQDADFDGDNVGPMAMDDDAAQNDLKNVMSVNQWMLDNDGKHNLLNINAEVVEMAVNTSNEYSVTKQDGNQLTGNFNDPSFRKAAIKNMRPDVVNKDWIDKDGNLTVNDADFMNAMVDNEIKVHYDKHDYVGARQKVDEIVQKARGYDVTRDKSGEVVKSLGKVSSLQNDGVDYTNKDTFVRSLNKFADEGAKGSRDKIKGLVEYMDKPTFAEVKKLNDDFNKDGKFDLEKYQKAQSVLKSLHDTQTEVQRATKTKSDATGVPGSTEQKYMATMMDQDDKSMHDALAVGQAGTQKILSIKRDPVGAGQISETLQEPLSKLLNGEFPKDSYPTFALVGAQRNGRLGTDVADAAIKGHVLRNYQDQETGMSLHDLKKTDKFTDKKAQEVMEKIGISAMPDKNDLAKQISGFKETVDEATEPYFRDDFMKQMKVKLAKSRKQNGDDVKIPSIVSERGNDGVAKDEFIEMMDYIYNDPNHGMGLGVSRKSIEGLAERNYDHTDSDNISPQMNSISDATSEHGDAPLVAKINMQGYSAINKELDDQDQGKEPESFMGKEGSNIREHYFAGLSDDQLDNLLSLQNQKTADEQLDKNGQFDLSQVNHFDSEIGNSDKIERNAIRISGDLGKQLQVSDDDKVLLRTKDDADIVLNVKVDQRLKSDKFMINSDVHKALDDVDRGVLATDTKDSNVDFQKHMAKFDENILKNDDTFSQYQANMRQKIQQRRIRLEQEEMLKTSNTELSTKIRDIYVNDKSNEKNALNYTDGTLQSALLNDDKKAINSENNNEPKITVADSNDEFSGNYNNENNLQKEDHKSVATKPVSNNNLNVHKQNYDQKDNYDVNTDVLQGTYYSPFEYLNNGKRYDTNSIRGYVGQQYLRLATKKADIDSNIVDLMRNASASENKEERVNLQDAYQKLSSDYVQKTNQKLFTPQNNQKFMSEAYYLQMTNDQQVNKVLHSQKDNLDNQSSINDVQRQAIHASVNYFDKQRNRKNVMNNHAVDKSVTQNIQGPNV